MTQNKLTLLMAGALVLAVGCGPKYPNCDTDEICQSKREVCVNGMCRQCRDDSHCASYGACGVCNSNACQKRDGCCTTDSECPNGKCWPVAGKPFGQCGKVCDKDHPCPPGYHCNGENQCEPDTECGPNVPCPPGKVCENGKCVSRCTAENIYFDFNESRLREDAKKTLSSNADCAKNQGKPVRVEGHCDERGDAEYNLALGERRASSAKKYLEGVGISNVKTISYGKEKPTCSESNEGCWSKNRRDEFHFE